MPRSETSETVGNRPPYPGSGACFADLLNWHLYSWGTRAGGTPEKAGEPWAKKEFAAHFRIGSFSLDSAVRKVANWTKGTHPPRDIRPIEHLLFGDVATLNGPDPYSDWRVDLRHALRVAPAVPVTLRGQTTTIGVAPPTAPGRHTDEGRASSRAPEPTAPQGGVSDPPQLPWWKGSAPSEPADKVAPDEALVNTIKAALAQNPQSPACVLSGQAGVGKSTLAALVAPRLAADSARDLYWVKFQPDGLHDGSGFNPIAALHALACNLGRPLPDDLDGKSLVRAIKDGLGQRPYLIVCDNVHNEEEFCQYDLRLPNGIIIVTSLSGMWEDIPVIPVDPWENSVARDYIRRRLPKDHPDRESDATLNRLAVAVEYLPLGLAQSTKYIQYLKGTSIDTYISKLREHAKTIISEPYRTLGRSRKTIQSTCYMLFEKVILARSRDQDGEAWTAALGLLCVAALLSVTGVDYKHLRSIFEQIYDPDGDGDVQLNSARMCLEDLSIISTSADGSEISLHQLTHVAARCWLENGYAASDQDIRPLIQKVFQKAREIIYQELVAEPGVRPDTMLLHVQSLLTLDGISAAECQGTSQDEFVEASISTLAESFAWPGRDAAVDYLCELASRAANQKNILFAEAVRAGIKVGNPGGLTGLLECEAVLVRTTEAFRALCENNIDRLHLCSMQRRLADARFDIGTMDEALEAVGASFDTLASIHDSGSIDYARSLAVRARILAHVGQSEASIADYDHAVRILRQANKRSFRINRDEVEFVYGRADIKVRIGRITEAIDDLRWAGDECEKIGYSKDDQGSIQNSLGCALLWHGDLEESMRWLETGRQGIGRSYGFRSPPYARQLFDISMQMLWQALMQSDDMHLNEAEIDPALRLAREALDISVTADKARRYAFEGSLWLCVCLVSVGAYKEAEIHVAHARALLQEIAAEESSRSALARRPRLLRAEAAVLLAVGQDKQAKTAIDELQQLRSHHSSENPGEDARNDCVISQVQFAIGGVSSVETKDMLQGVKRHMIAIFGEKSPIASLAEKLAARYANEKVADQYRRLPVIF